MNLFTKNKWSLFACLSICAILSIYRIQYLGFKPGEPAKITAWDATGYYLYLPSILIYHDFKELKWFPEIDKKYGVSGGNFYQAQKTDNGNYAFKYLGGVAVMQLPLFLVGHVSAQLFHFPQDGFSPPYQYALAFGILIYCFIAIFILRRILLFFFNDGVTAITISLLCLATNFIQYAAVDSGQSHAYIFLLYAIEIYATIQWHKKPTLFWVFVIGYVLGLSTISRPTEAIMILIPLLWNTTDKKLAFEKWNFLRNKKMHILVFLIAGFIAILPQLIYWKLATGSFVYDVGSKWDFLLPHFQVLFGWEKGWFIYTPVTLFFIFGFFFMKKFVFRKSVLWFCILNIYIIIAWHDWRYGGSYSTRALVQSYPVFALPLAGFINYIVSKKYRYIIFAVFVYLLAVNLFQITQYCSTILHYNDMNRNYYGRIYLNPKPTPADLSLMDTEEFISDETNYKWRTLWENCTPTKIHFSANSNSLVQEIKLVDSIPTKSVWLKVEAAVKAPNCLWQSFMQAQLTQGDSIKRTKIRLFSPVANNDSSNQYTFYMRVPDYFKNGNLKISLTSSSDFSGELEKLKVTSLTN